MADVFVGSVSVGVVPDARGWNQKLRAELVPTSSQVGDEVGRNISKGVVGNLGSPGTKAGMAKAGTESAGAFGDSFRKRLDAALKNLPKAQIDANSTPAERRVEELRRKMVELLGKEIGVDLSAEEAMLQLKLIDEELKGIHRDSKDIRISFDTAEARAQIALLKHDLSGADKGSRIGGLAGAASGIGAGVSPLISGAALATPAAAAVGGVGLGAAGGLAGAAVAATGAFAAFGAVAKPVLTEALKGEQAVHKAQDAYNVAIASGTDKAKAYKTEQLAIAKAYAGMSPAQIALSKQLGNMADAWQKVKTAETPVVAGALQPWLHAITRLIGDLDPIIRRVAVVIRQLGSQFDTLVGSPAFTRFRDWVAVTGSTAIGAFGKAFLGFFQAMITLLPKFNPLIIDATNWLAKLGPALVKWANSQKTADNITKFMGWFRQNGPAVGKMLESLAKALGGLLPGLTAGGMIEIRFITDFLNFINKLPKGLSGPIIAVTGGLLLLNKLGVTTVILKAFTAQMWLLNLAMDANPFGIVLLAIEALAVAFVLLYTRSKTFRDFIHGLPHDFDTFRHETAVIFDGVRHDIAHTWDQIFENSIGIIIRLTHNVETQFNSMRHGIAVVFDGMRHEVINIMNLLYGGTIGVVIRISHNVATQFNSMRHGIAVIFDGIRHDIAHVWDQVYSNTIGAVIRVWQKTNTPFANMRHDIAGHMNGIRHDIAAAWNTIYSNTIGSVIRLGHNVETQFNSLRHSIAGIYDGIRHDISHYWDLIYQDTIGRVIRMMHEVESQLNKLRHTIAGIYNAIRHDISHVWDLIYQDTIGRVIRMGHDVESQLDKMRHSIAGTYNGIRHDASSTWDAVWSNTVGRAIRGAKDLMGVFSKLKSDVVGFFRDSAKWLVDAGKSIISGLLNGIAQTMKDIGGWINNNVVQPIINAVKHFFGISSPASAMVPLGKSLVTGMIKGMLTSGADLGNLVGKIFGGWPHALAHMVTKSLIAVKNLPRKAVDALGNIGSGIGKFFSKMIGEGGGSVQRWAGIVGQALSLLHLPSSLTGQVLHQVQSESGGNPNAINTTDINAQRGDPSRGLLQTIGSTFAAYHVAGTSSNIYDPLANVAAAINYAQARYGPTLMRGGAGLGSGHGYDSGGWLPTGATLAFNSTGRPELVMTADQASRAMAGGTEYHAHFDGLTGAAIESHVRTAFQAMSLNQGSLYRQGRRQ